MELPLDDFPLKMLEDPIIIQQTKECAFAAINDGYTHIVYNFVRSANSQLNESDICTFKGFDLEALWHEFSIKQYLPKFKQLIRPSNKNLNEYIKQYTRLTVVIDSVSYIHNFVNLVSDSNNKTSIIDSYNILALRCKPKAGTNNNDVASLFEQLCTKTDCDIITLDQGKRLNFFLQKSCVKLALQRGAVFEINYGQGMLENYASERKTFLQNAMSIIKLTKGKGIILSSESNNRLFMRSPIDVCSIGKLLGLNDQQARQTITTNCLNVLQHAHYRKTHKGVAQIT